MSRATLCDRCGLVVRGAVPTVPLTIDGKAMDLCAACSESLALWREGRATEPASIDSHFARLRGAS